MSPSKQGSPIQFRDVEVERELDRRSNNHNYAARRDLARYYELLRREMRSLGLLEQDEFLIAEACAGMEFTPDTAPFIRTAVREAMEESNLAEKWRVNPEQLNAKLKKLTPGQAMALVDWIESCVRWPEYEGNVRDAVFGGPWLGTTTIRTEDLTSSFR
jgi:hypothetical protein